VAIEQDIKAAIEALRMLTQELTLLRAINDSNVAVLEARNKRLQNKINCMRDRCVEICKEAIKTSEFENASLHYVQRKTCRDLIEGIAAEINTSFGRTEDL